MIGEELQKLGLTCPRCKGGGWVCENHPDQAWPDECQCGAGMPCPDCREDRFVRAVQAVAAAVVRTLRRA